MSAMDKALLPPLSEPFDIEKAIAKTLAKPNPIRDALLTTREQTHGSFADNAKLWDDLIHCFRDVRLAKFEHRLAVNMIFLKLARLASNPNFADHWDDIAGYAKLGSEACD